MASDEEFEDDELDFEDSDDGGDELDFEAPKSGEEDVVDAPVQTQRSGGSDVYTAMLVISAVFYIIALVATFASMKPYCKQFLWDLF